MCIHIKSKNLSVKLPALHCIVCIHMLVSRYAALYLYVYTHNINTLRTVKYVYTHIYELICGVVYVYTHILGVLQYICMCIHTTMSRYAVQYVYTYILASCFLSPASNCFFSPPTL